jgi:molybdenum cofactor cytidylyltransferase
MKISVLILAAGNSSRLGHPKQLVEFEGQTLIERITHTALAVSDSVSIVLGANIESIKPVLEPFSDRIEIIENALWQEGMGTSIRVGVEKIAQKSDAILILLSDQPLISQVLLQNMMQTFANSKQTIVACDYGTEIGVPMLFDKSIFPELLMLYGDIGAKSFLKHYPQKIAKINFEQGLLDIDTPEDIEKLSVI